MVAWKHQAITLTNADARTAAFTPGQFHKKMTKISFPDISWKLHI